MAGVKGMYQGPKRVTWEDVYKQFEWFKTYRPGLAVHGLSLGNRLALAAYGFDPKPYCPRIAKYGFLNVLPEVK